MSDLADCIVSYFDLIGIGEKITAENKEATDLMRTFHVFVNNSINFGMRAHQLAYVWNDSAVLLAFPQDDSGYETVMRELNEFKAKLDSINPSYAICIKGRAIPEPVCGYGTVEDGQPRFIFLKTSSYAFANCFAVEEELKKLRMDWYIDGQIAAKIPSFPKCDQHAVEMLPDRTKRDICSIKGSIWELPK
jgi:hypothetical protein